MLASVPGAKLDSPLRRELAARGIRFTWLCRQLGIGAWTFSRIEGGTQPAPAGFYERAAAILGVPVEQIEREPKEVAA